ncbi:aldo/keto reductase [Nocardiopsis aegyptia]|uniref:Aryl-alcohol dehydrogenase-like predicted oxidoreductase n=1 Tax=Nocardiopsis aegyptia TaxID=220378 RepID=A0A7Z0J8H6_9ACTN|nr:aldo/keto reductase [Nocardiopsis aegyptia]NYJ33123.1 aryl-alcohol dehydrogenase-like predicted oxidoreductase [Nocardiopsis aegyptia]
MTESTARRLGRSDLLVSPLCLGGNVFGWTADEDTSFRVLDAYRDAGGTFVDTADSYSAWAEGHTGGESETVIGAWLASRGRPDDLVVATKVSQHPEFPGLSADNVRAAAHASLKRLGVDAIDLYYAHFDDPRTPVAESAGAFSALVDEGKVRAIGLSNHSPERITEWLDVCRDRGLHAPVCVQPQYNLMERAIEADLVPLARERGLALLPYFGLARGFLTGKYRPGGGDVDSPRAGRARAYLERPEGPRVLAALDAIAAERDAAPATIALAWLVDRPGVASVLASARDLDQWSALLPVGELRLTDQEKARLDEASHAGA